MTQVLRKSTPVLVVDRIEPAIPFWQKVGLQLTTQVPDEKAGDGRLAFVILAADGVEIMYQTVDSVQADLQASSMVSDAFPSRPQQTCLFIEVSDLAGVEARLHGEKLVMPRRTTFYGMSETGYTEPCGNVVVFAQHMEKGIRLMPVTASDLVLSSGGVFAGECQPPLGAPSGWTTRICLRVARHWEINATSASSSHSCIEFGYLGFGPVSMAASCAQRGSARSAGFGHRARGYMFSGGQHRFLPS